MAKELSLEEIEKLVGMKIEGQEKSACVAEFLALIFM